MITILAPARNMRRIEMEGIEHTAPLFPDEAQRIAGRVRELAPYELESLLDVDERRALQLHGAYRAFDATKAGTPALLANWGAAFRSMNPTDFDACDFAFAQQHLRILSALYGLLRPLDSVQEHRLGLSKRGFHVDGKDLYAYWGDRLHRALFQSGEPVLNLASENYTKLIEPYLRPQDTLIRCRFQVQKPDGARGTVATIRMARGQMARCIIKNRIDSPGDIRRFAWNGYRFMPGGSSERSYLFIQM